MTTIARAGTEQEQRELHSLNQRFEFYILQQREKDAMNLKLQEDLAELLEKSKQELHNCRHRHYDQMGLLETQTQQVNDALLQADTAVRGKEAEVQSLTLDLATKDAQARDEQAEHQRLLGDNADLKRDNFDKNSQVAELDRRRQAQVLHVADLEQQLPLVQADIQAVTDEFFREHAKGEAVDKEIREEQQDFEAHMNEHHTEKPIAESHFKVQAKVDHDEYKDVLVRDLHAQNDSRNKTNEDTMTHLYEHQCSGYRSEIENLQGQVERKSKSVSDNLDHLQDAINALNEQSAGLQDDIAVQKTDNATLAERKNAEIANLKAAASEKLKEMNQLMELKLPTVVEIAHMEEILASEERRLGITDDSEDAAPLTRTGSKRKAKQTPLNRRTSSRLKTDL